jgi:hypothetical protein
VISRARLLAALSIVCCLAAGAFASSAFAVAPAPAWAPVAAAGPTVLPPLQSEVQKLWVDAEGGTYTLSFSRVGNGKGNLAANSTTVTNVSTSSGVFLVGQKITAFGISTATGTGTFTSGSKNVTGVSTAGTLAVGQSIEGSGIPADAKIATVGPGTLELSVAATASGSGVQFTADTTIVAVGANTLTLSNPATFTFAEMGLSANLVTTTPPVAFDAAPSVVEAALNALSNIGGAGGSVQVTGGPGSAGGEKPYVVAFGGSLANIDVGQMEADSGLLVGGLESAALSTAVPGGAGTSTLMVYLQNIGGAASNEGIATTYKVTLPPGVELTKEPDGGFFTWECTGAAGDTEFTCTSGFFFETIAPTLVAPPIQATVTATPGAEGGDVHLKASGGGAAVAENDIPLVVSATPSQPGVQSFAAGAYDADGKSDTRAGAHPYSAGTAIFVNTKRSVKGGIIPAGELRDIIVDLPPGFLGNPIAVPQCPESTQDIKCPLDTMVGVAQLVYGAFQNAPDATSVFNTEAPLGYPAKYRFNVGTIVPLTVVGSLRSDEDYGLTAASINTPPIAQLYGTFFTFWGAPADPSHDSSRCRDIVNGTGCVASSAANTALLTSATNCAEQAANPPVTPLSVTFWQFPGLTSRDSADIPPVTGCENLHFEADFTFEPSDTKADSPASFRTSLTVPSEGLTDPEKLTTPEIRNTVVQLPKGVVLNASGADGLEACSLSQIGYKGNNFPMPNPIRFNKDPNQCPEASKIGTGELKTALLEEPLHGALYLAAQGDGNPFGSLFAIYLVIEDPRHGIFIKLPGKVEPDSQTGQMTVSFENLPQLPFTRLDLNLKGGNRSALASPTTCGNYVTTATNTPWSAPESGPPTVSSNGFDINQGPNGTPCANTPSERPFDIGWNAGADTTKAGASGPFQFQITRPDGSQELTGLELNTPKGLSASLKGIPYCSADQIAQAEGSTGKQELANPACSSASQVGTLETGAGSGPSPFYVNGKIYLAGPYKGAPISVVAVTPAVAGPFDLGNVVVRSAVNINRSSAQVSAKTDAIPQILKGVVLRIKDVRIKLDHKDWTINPTSCDASSVNLKATGNSGATAERSTRFQVGGCKDLNFKPKLTGKLKGGTKRGAHPAFTAELTYPPGPGYANIKDVQVTLPHSEFLDQAHINTICTRPQAAAHQCPAGSIYGFAEAESPLIDGKLTGPVFLKSSDHQLPDLAIALRGPDNQPVEVEFQGRIDSVHAQIRNTIEGLPDVPVSKFVLRMKGGKKGLLVNSRNLCATKVTKMTVKMSGQNNRSTESNPPLKRTCKKAKGSDRKKRGPRRG